ncbi:uncharacterized protein LOC116264058 isoform X6 [Nymphaea colorata]|uniref:uncharacterized protein LOC116264058 isoform X6 n=1 Tax=Nymphaea colorata TaxID=210225 RepID=UPI00129E81A5|nr:uncharacterized protein LOC116264058 isoform X6 [Nymphaea colorata]
MGNKKSLPCFVLQERSLGRSHTSLLVDDSFSSLAFEHISLLTVAALTVTFSPSPLRSSAGSPTPQSPLKNAQMEALSLFLVSSDFCSIELQLSAV